MLERLIDHAALFPPASMSLARRSPRTVRARESPHAGMLNRFVVPGRAARGAAR